MLLLFAACSNELVRTCSEVETTTTADAMLDLGFTPADLVAGSNIHSLTMYDLAGEPHGVEISATLGAGDIALVDKTIVDEGDPDASYITVTFNDGCLDEVTVPVDVSLAGEGVEIEATGTVFSADDGQMGTGSTIDGTFDPATSLFPPGFHAGPVDGVVVGAFAPSWAPSLKVWVTAADGTREAVLSTVTEI